MTLSERRTSSLLKFFDSFLEFLTVMVLTFVLSKCFIVKLLTKPILLRKIWNVEDSRMDLENWNVKN